MADQVRVTIRTADKTRKAEVTLPRSMTVNDLIEASKKNWDLPANTEYQIANVSLSKQLAPNQALGSDVARDDDELEILPFLVAGVADVCQTGQA